jgi:hypothetical protein
MESMSGQIIHESASENQVAANKPVTSRDSFLGSSQKQEFTPEEFVARSTGVSPEPEKKNV